MQTYTNRADELFREAEEYQHQDYIAPYTSCYDSLFEQQEIYSHGKAMEIAARDIRRRMQEIADTGFPIHSSSMLRKAVVSCRKGKLAFNHEQLKQVVAMVMQDGAYIVFKPKSETKEYVILLFWSTSIDESECKIQQQVEIVKKEIAVDNFRLMFRVENVADPKRQFHYLLNKLTVLSLQNDDIVQLPAEDHKQLNSFLKLLKEQKSSESNKKRKTTESLQKLFDDWE